MPPHRHHHHLPPAQDGKAGAANRDAGRRLLATLGVTGTIMVAELIGGALSKSLSLMADAGHMLTDLLGVGVAYAALRLALRPADARRTYGYRRFEVLAALVNGLGLFAICGVIALEGVQRLMHPEPVEVHTMLGVAVLGLVANLIGLKLIGHGSHNINLRGAFLHLLGDTLASAGVVVGALLIRATGALWIDPLLSILISLLIAGGAYRMLREVVDVLLEAVPAGLSIEAIEASMLGVAGVEEVFDLHVWSITQGLPALSAHVLLKDPQADVERVLYSLQAMLKEKFSIDHATLQIERRR
jgi:cobalt-zinc-cadmium efflux system protein